jgi:hypothetical protein
MSPPFLYYEEAMEAIRHRYFLQQSPRDRNAAMKILAGGVSAAGLGDVSRPIVGAVSA